MDGEITEVTPLAGGTQNVVLRVVVDGRRLVLRRPPAHPRPNSDRTIAREITVLRALAGSGVPHPELVAGCTDTDVLGVVFYLMTDVDGLNPGEAVSPSQEASEQLRHDGALDVARAAARLGTLDPHAIGLGGLQRPGSFLERQVPQWRTHLAGYDEVPGYESGTLPDVDLVADWLEQNRPPDAAPGVVHGDLHLNNVMLHRTEPRVAAVIDWEMCTVGDPLLDLGWLMVTWPQEPVGMSAGPALSALGGLPSRAELVAAYADAGGRDTSWIDFYTALAGFKMGIVLEGTQARAAAGQAPAAVGRTLHEHAVGLLGLSGAVARGQWSPTQ
ncbi:phosphotransferase family protein [Pseudonocardia sp. KRD-291]|nr:phosphotransferase family protein [Pseudonocardia sp. KRD291]